MSSRGASKTAFVSPIRNVHFSSVLMLRLLGLKDSMSFHPALAKALEKRAGAAADFRDWAEELIERWRDAQNLCAAHTATLRSRQNNGASIHARLVKALAKVEGTLTAHQRKHG
jgi:hypothetical protein